MTAVAHRATVWLPSVLKSPKGWHCKHLPRLGYMPAFASQERKFLQHNAGPCFSARFGLGKKADVQNLFYEQFSPSRKTVATRTQRSGTRSRTRWLFKPIKAILGSGRSPWSRTGARGSSACADSLSMIASTRRLNKALHRSVRSGVFELR